MIKIGCNLGLCSKWKINLENITLFTSTDVWNKNYDKIYTPILRGKQQNKVHSYVVGNIGRSYA